jgi:MFS family permease
MLAAPFTGGVMIFAFYGAQPYLLQLYGNDRAYAVAGLAAALFAGAQIAGGLLVPHVRRLVDRRTSVLVLGTAMCAVVLAIAGLVPRFWTVVALLAIWALVSSLIMPVRQAYLNGLIASKERATVLSFDSLLGSTGAVGIQPMLGRVADVQGYPASYVVSAAIQALAVPFYWLARRERARSDAITESGADDSRAGTAAAESSGVR